MEKTKFGSAAIFLWRVYRFAFVMVLLAIVPGFNFFYSGHGGLAWLVLPFVFPVTLWLLYREWRQAAIQGRPSPTQLALWSLISYFPISYLGAVLGAASIQDTFGLPVQPIFLWGFFIFPFGLAFNASFFGL